MPRRQALILCGWLALPPPAFAVGGDCTCTPASTTINFGAYDVLGGAPLDGAGSFSVACRNDNNRRASIAFVAKLATAPARALATVGEPDRLSYQVYVDSARTQPWGDGTAGTFTINGAVAVPARDTVTVGPISYYGRITPGGQDVAATFPGALPTPYGQALTISVTCVAN